MRWMHYNFHGKKCLRSDSVCVDNQGNNDNNVNGSGQEHQKLQQTTLHAWLKEEESQRFR